jgi:hypothetical protein
LEEKLEIAKPILVPKQKRNMVLKGERDFIWHKVLIKLMATLVNLEFEIWVWKTGAVRGMQQNL